MLSRDGVMESGDACIAGAGMRHARDYVTMIQKIIFTDFGCYSACDSGAPIWCISSSFLLSLSLSSPCLEFSLNALFFIEELARNTLHIHKHCSPCHSKNRRGNAFQYQPRNQSCRPLPYLRARWRMHTRHALAHNPHRLGG